DHAVEDVDELLAVVLRTNDAVEVVAAHAVEQRLLVLIGAREAREPFGVRHLLRKVLGGRKLDLDILGLAGGDVGAARAFEVVADRPDAETVLAGVKPPRWEAE